MPPETLKLHKEVEIMEYFISTNRDRLMATEVLKVVKKMSTLSWILYQDKLRIGWGQNRSIFRYPGFKNQSHKALP